MNRRNHGIVVYHLARNRGWRVTIYDPGSKTYWYCDGKVLSEVLDRAYGHAKKRILRRYRRFIP